MPSVRKLEVGLMKFYIVHAAQNNKPERVMEFFEKMTPEIQNQSEFKEWFGKQTSFLACLFEEHGELNITLPPRQRRYENVKVFGASNVEACHSLENL